MLSCNIALSRYHGKPCLTRPHEGPCASIMMPYRRCVSGCWRHCPSHSPKLVASGTGPSARCIHKALDLAGSDGMLCLPLATP